MIFVSVGWSIVVRYFIMFNLLEGKNMNYILSKLTILSLIFLSLVVSGCASKQIASNNKFVPLESNNSDPKRTVLIKKAKLSLDDYDAVKGCLREKETLAIGMTWGNVAYISAAISGISTLGTSTALAGGFGVLTGVSKYFDDDNAYRKARATIETQYSNGIEKFKQELNDEKYPEATKTLDVNDIVVSQNRNGCDLPSSKL